MRVELTALARLDLGQIGRYGAVRWGREQARRYAAQLRETLGSLAEHPYSGRPYLLEDGTPSGYRQKKAGSHVVFYRVVDMSVEVGRILHASQDALRHLA